MSDKARHRDQGSRRSRLPARHLAGGYSLLWKKDGFIIVSSLIIIEFHNLKNNISLKSQHGGLSLYLLNFSMQDSMKSTGILCVNAVTQGEHFYL